jgi:hypothetical protein
MPARNLYRHQLDREADGALTYLLLGDLRELLSERPAGPRTRAALLAILEALLDEIPNLAGPDAAGDAYLDGVLADCPNWTPQVDALRAAKIADTERLSELRDAVQSRRPFVALADGLVDELGEWMAAFGTHRRQERRLVQMAANTDVGGEA